MTEENMIILGIIGLLIFAYFNRIDRYIGKIDQFINNVALDNLG